VTVEVREFRRDDREQLAALVNAHIAAVVPGMSVSVNRLLSQLEREPDEFIVDPWVVERVTIVAVQRQRVAAAAHLHRYGSDALVGEAYRGAAGIRWFVSWPEARYWPDAVESEDVLLQACVAQFDRWGTPHPFADGSLPAPAVYGIPAQWPHVGAALERAGFEHEGRVEIIHVLDLAKINETRSPKLTGLSARRSLGANGIRFEALLNGRAIGYIEVESLGDAERLSRFNGWADIGNLFVSEPHRGQGVGTWLIHQAVGWLRLAHVDRLLAYATPEEEAAIALYATNGFEELTRIRRGWVRRGPGSPTINEGRVTTG
jgi:GNAT superfamily N-acetyltransferase